MFNFFEFDCPCPVKQPLKIIKTWCGLINTAFVFNLISYFIDVNLASF